MNRKQRRTLRSDEKYAHVIYFRGKPYTIEEAIVLAMKEYSLGHAQMTIDIYNLIISKLPNYAEVYFNRGKIEQELERYKDALISYEKAIMIKPDYVKAYNNLGAIFQQMNNFEEALICYDKALALSPEHIIAYNNKGIVLQMLRRYDEALENYDKALELKPDYAEAYNNRGNTMVSKGDMEEAEKMFHKALELKPDFPTPLYCLTKIRKYKNVEHEDIPNIKKMLDSPAVHAGGKECLFFALGKIYDDCGHYEEAFEYYRQANIIGNKALSYNAPEVANVTNNILELLNKEFFAQPSEFAQDSELPVFIIGMPRSGTTLLTSILSNHPLIGTAGELPTMMEFTSNLSKLLKSGASYPRGVKELTSDMVIKLVNEYDHLLRRDVDPHVVQIIDKFPLNFKFLGIISMLFPKAKIIHCMRDPLDTCLSNYFQRFSQYYDYSFDLANIGHFYKEYLRLMDHWRQVLPNQMIEINYEEMVLDTEKVARKTLDFLGMEWNDRCLAPHTNPCAVETASQWQVRQPIYHQSIGRWHHYEKQLGPLKEMLGC